MELFRRIESMNTQLFRKKSLEQLQSPDQLDSLLTVTSLRGWIALTGTVVLLIVILVWGFFGNLPVNVNGQGIFLSSGGIQNVISNENGQISDISVEPGDMVEKGQVVARLAQPEILDKIHSVEAQLDQLDSKGQGQNQAKWKDLKKELKSLQNELNMATRVISSFSGKVIEVKAKRGQFINKGTTIISIERVSGELNELQVLLYVSPEDGKKVHSGMEVKIEPSTILKENYGYLQGKVNTVNDFPSTAQGMLETIGNEELVKTLSGSGAPIQVTISLIPDKNTVSGYKWTSTDGPPVDIQSGTLANGLITIADSPPISRVFPQFK